MIMLPISGLLFSMCLMVIGFFGRGFYVASLIYINEIGGDKFRAWSYIVVFGVWGVAPLLLAIESLFELSLSWWIFVFVLVPFVGGCYFVLKYWKRSPLNLYMKSNNCRNQEQYVEAKEVLNDMAR